MGGVYLSESEVISSLTHRTAGFLKELSDTNGYAMVVTVLLKNKGTDLDLDHEGFAVRYAPADGTVTKRG